MTFEYDPVTKLRITSHIHDVHLYQDGSASSWPYLSKKAKDQINWISDGPAFEIHFNHSPFADDAGNEKRDFTVPAGGSTRSGEPVLGVSNRDETDVKGDYMYTSKSSAREMAADPGLSVTP